MALRHSTIDAGGVMNSICKTTDLLVFSHLRWDLVFHRPQHLMSRFARHRRVYYIEGPIFDMTEVPRLHLRETQEGVHVVVPYLPPDIKPDLVNTSLKELIDNLLFKEGSSQYTLWFYTPAALPFTRHLCPVSIIYDCIEEDLQQHDYGLMEIADLVFTSTHFLYEAKKHFHHNIHAFPSSIDYEHFSQARLSLVEPEDQVNIAHPRIGFHGSINEDLDKELLEEMAVKRPEYQFVILGPIVSIPPETLPIRHNIFYLDDKEYHALPLYFSGWDCGILPLTLAENANPMEPTKASEFLAAGKPVVSTPVRHGLMPLIKRNLVHIASSGDEFLSCIERAINERSCDPDWINRVDLFLSTTSWESVFLQMAGLESGLRNRTSSRVLKQLICPLVSASKGEINSL